MLSIPVRFLLAYCVAVALPAQTKLFPVDETQKDRDFASYVKRLKKAVAERDVKALKKLCDGSIAVQEKPELKGWDEFEKKWTPGDPKSRLWSTLEDFLDLGFIQETPYTFLSPYVVWRFPNHLDPAKHWVVAWGDEALREKPDARSKELRRVAFEIVRRVPAPGGGDAGVEAAQPAGAQQTNARGAGARQKDAPLGDAQQTDAQRADAQLASAQLAGGKWAEARWAEVETQDGARGWMSLAALKSPTMPHAQFNYEKGRWLMVMLED